MLNRSKAPADYGQSVVIGSVLMFGILIIALSIYQASVVPQQNQEVEFQHYTELRSDMTTYNTAIHQSKTLETTSTTITVSTPYPTRLVTVNPPPFTTSLSTSDNTSSTISNFEVQSTGNESDYWSQQSQLTIPTSTVNARPDYNMFQNSNPIIYENQVTYIPTEQLEPVITNSRPLVEGRTIEIHGYTGNISSPTSSEQQITVEQVSSSRDVLYITGSDSTTPIQLQIETQIPEITWRNILDVASNNNIESTDYNQSSDILTIELDGSETYVVEAYLSATNPSESIKSTSEPEYIQNLTGDTVVSGQSIILSAHDELGNTTPGSVVTVTDDPSNCLSFTEKRTNNLGEVTFTCQTTQDTSVSFHINQGAESYETITVDVSDTGGTTSDPAQDITATINSISSTQAGGGPPASRPYDIQVDWQITTQGGTVDSATLTLRDSQGNIVDQRQLSPNSTGDSGQEVFRVTGRGNNYVATLTATNQSGAESEDTATVTT